MIKKLHQKKKKKKKLHQNQIFTPFQMLQGCCFCFIETQMREVLFLLAFSIVGLLFKALTPYLHLVSNMLRAF